VELSVFVKACRKRAGLTQAGLAQKVGVSRGAVAAWEGGTQALEWKNIKSVIEAAGLKLDQCLSLPPESDDDAKLSVLRDALSAGGPMRAQVELVYRMIAQTRSEEASVRRQVRKRPRRK
jgi:DNA-binding XRE family transcriptional regulator